MAGTLLFKKVFTATNLSDVYDCKKCDTYQKKERGCKRNKRQSVIELECICKGAKKCNICGGQKKGNAIKVYRCPRVYLFDISISRIVPYFYHWLASDFMVFPDGRGRYYQPKKLIIAFDILLELRNREVAIEKEKDGKETSN